MDKTQPKFEPDDMECDLSKGLTITWGDGERHFIPVRYLRLHSPCAQWREYTKNRTPDQLEVIFDTVPKDVTLAEAWEVGLYALGFQFSDGHKTGIFEFHYLRQLGEDYAFIAKNTPDAVIDLSRTGTSSASSQSETTPAPGPRMPPPPPTAFEV